MDFLGFDILLDDADGADIGQLITEISCDSGNLVNGQMDELSASSSLAKKVNSCFLGLLYWVGVSVNC